MGYAGHYRTSGGPKQRRRLSSKDRRDLMRRLGRRCAVCAATQGLHLHHRIPVSEGGPHNIRNFEVRCERHRHDD